MLMLLPLSLLLLPFCYCCALIWYLFFLWFSSVRPSSVRRVWFFFLGGTANQDEDRSRIRYIKMLFSNVVTLLVNWFSVKKQVLAHILEFVRQKQKNEAASFKDYNEQFSCGLTRNHKNESIQCGKFEEKNKLNVKTQNSNCQKQCTFW